MYYFYFSQAEIAERKVRRKQAKGKKAEIIPDPDFRLINKDRDEFKYPQKDAELHYPVLKQRSSFSALDIFKVFFSETLLRKLWETPIQGTNNVDYWKRPGNTIMNAGLLFLAYKIRILALQNAPSESQKTANPLEHSYQEACAHFLELLYPGQNTKGR